MAKSIQSKVSSSVASGESADVKALRMEIARLKRQIAYESLRAEAYDELINVAEQQFNISIRKKE